MADVAAILPYAERLDGRTVRMTFEDHPTAMRGLRASIYMAGVAERRLS